MIGAPGARKARRQTPSDLVAMLDYAERIAARPMASRSTGPTRVDLDGALRWTCTHEGNARVIEESWRFWVNYGHQCVVTYLAVTGVLLAVLYKILKDPGFRRAWKLPICAGLVSSVIFLVIALRFRAVYLAILVKAPSDSFLRSLDGSYAGWSPLLVAATGLVAWLALAGTCHAGMGIPGQHDPPPAR